MTMTQQQDERILQGNNSDHHHHDDNVVLVHVSTLKLCLSMAPLLVIVAISAHMSLHLERAIVVASVRTFVQLSVLAIILEPIFVWGETMPGLVVAYCALMILLATYESVHRSTYSFQGMWMCVLFSLAVNVAMVGVFAFGVILQPTPPWDPQYVIPIVGMLMGNSINGISLSLNFLLTSLVEQALEIETYLSWAATPREATARLLREAVRVGAMPQLNSMAIIGLISIPGMMTGQILGGSPVKEAAHYQMLIMYLIAICTFGTILTEIIMALQAGFDGAFRLRTDRLVKQTKATEQSSSGGDRSWCSKLQQSLCCCCIPKPKTAIDSSSNGVLAHDNQAKEITPLVTRTASFSSDKEQGGEAHPRGSIQLRTLYSAPNAADTPAINHSDQSIRRSFRLEIDNLTHSFVRTTADGGSNHDHQKNGLPLFNSNGNHGRILFDHLSWELHPGQILLVGGPSGVGKTTLLRLIAGLAATEDSSPTNAIRLHVTPDEQHYNHSHPISPTTTSTTALPFPRLSSRRTSSMSQAWHLYQPHRDRTLWRLHVRHVAQHKVNMPGTPREFLHTVASFQAWQQQDHSATNARSLSHVQQLETTTAELVQSWGMDATVCLDRPWSTLSGGESQRVMIAMALASQPHVLLLDESTSALDLAVKQRVEQTIVAYCRNTHMSVLWVTHDQDQVTRLSNSSDANGDGHYS